MLRRLAPVLLVVMLLGAFGWTLYFLYERSKDKPTVFEVTTPTMSAIIKKTVAAGAIVPRKEIAIKSRVSGIISELFVKPGDVVKKDGSLARIKIIPNVVTLNNAEASVASSKISFENAKRERERYKSLMTDGVLSQTDFNRYQVDYELREQELASATSNLSLIKDGAARGAGRISNEVTSTVPGTVIEVPVKEGSSVIESNNFNEGTTIAAVADMKDMLFQGTVDESEIGKLKEGMPVDISIGAIEGKRFKGTLEYISPKGLAKEGTIEFEVKAAIQLDASFFIRANYSANADIILDRREHVLTIEESLLTFEKGKPFVEVEVGPQRFEKRAVTLGLSDGVNVEVLSGVGLTTKLKKPLAAGGNPAKRPRGH